MKGLIITTIAALVILSIIPGASVGTFSYAFGIFVGYANVWMYGLLRKDN